VKFVLGGEDTEMNAIESLLKTFGHEVVYAQCRNKRVTRSRAYHADGPILVPGDVWVECRPNNFDVKKLASLGISVVDHHAEGDPGFNRPSSEYWEASSLGQICELLEVKPNKLLRFIAAADHCLLAAYHNQCPGVKREEFFDYRMTYFSVSKDDPAAFMKELHKKAQVCPTIDINGSKVYDITRLKRHSAFFSDMSCYYNMKIIQVQKQKAQKTKKYFVCNLSAEDIVYFMEEYSKGLGDVLNVYGDPKRQFAAVVVKYDGKD